VLIFLRAGLTIKISFTKDWGADDPGVGSVGKSIVVTTMILTQRNSCLQQKIITMIHVVGKKKVLKKKSIVVEGVQATVPDDGRFTVFVELSVLPGDAGKGIALLSCCSRDWIVRFAASNRLNFARAAFRFT
jgi:hypothetical protein